MDCFLTLHDIIFHGARCTTLCESKTPLSYSLRNHWDVTLDHGQSITLIGIAIEACTILCTCCAGITCSTFCGKDSQQVIYSAEKLIVCKHRHSIEAGTKVLE